MTNSMAIPKYVFFSGKGGVGKSSMAATTAVYLAGEGRKTLLVSTDPAGNLGDIFSRNISTEPVALSSHLDAIQLDSDRITEAYKRNLLAPLEAILSDEQLLAVREQFNGGCTVEIATFDRFTDFLNDLNYEHILFDTAPTGHTLRLMTLPGEWNDYILRSEQGSGQTCIGPVSQIQDARAKYEHAVLVLRDPAQCMVYMVSRPEKTSVYETKRALAELQKTGIHRFSIIVNGIIPPDDGPPDLFQSLRLNQLGQIQSLLDIGLPVIQVPMQAGEIKGFNALQHLGSVIYRKSHGDAPAQMNHVPEFKAFANPGEFQRVISAESGRRIVVLTGKGGVGKTVAACAIARHTARQAKTLLITTDPAAHIGQVLEAQVTHEPSLIRNNLWAVNIDQRKAAEVYKEKILNDARQQNYSPELYDALAEELESPCTEEIAVFELFSQYLTDEQWHYTVIDTAPTGHTLRLLELPFDYRRQIAVKPGQDSPETIQSKQIDKVIDLLKDRDTTRFFLVAYPEYTPLHESKRAAQDLERVGIHIAGVLMNQILRKDECGSDFGQSRWSMQQHYLHQAAQLFDRPLYPIPLRPVEISGSAELDALGRELFDPTPHTAAPVKPIYEV